MLKKCGKFQVPTEDDRAFFAKILWVIITRRCGADSLDKYWPQTEKYLKKELHRKQVKIMSNLYK